MQFKVPQFLEIEDKIFGPFTFRQFVYLTGGAGMCFLLYRLLGLWVSAIPIVAIAGFALALAFYKPNNKPFIFMVQAVFKYFLQGRMYIWKNPKNGILIKNQVQAGLGIGNQNISSFGNLFVSSYIATTRFIDFCQTIRSLYVVMVT